MKFWARTVPDDSSVTQDEYVSRMGVLERLPAWATTGVGSLPYTEGRTAAGQAVKAYDLPFCPQLPRLEGDMVAEWLGADPARCGVHLCCAVPWDVVQRAAPDVLSFDLTLGLEDGGAEAVRRLVAGGTRIAWGVLAPHLPDADADAAGLLDVAIARTGVAPTMSLLTPTCGTGRMAPRREVAVSTALGELARAGRSTPPSS
jgi:hypothetical protein